MVRPLRLLLIALLMALLLPACAQRAKPLPGGDAARGEPVRVVPPASTFCNPLDLDYRFALDTPSRRDIADPVIVRFENEYYLFAARSGGYWHSPDLREWKLVVPTGLPMDDSSPRVLLLGQIYYSSRDTPALYTSDDPATGVWRRATDAEASRAARASELWEQARATRHDGGGFAGRSEAASTFEDASEQLWQVAAIGSSVAGSAERRLGIFPVTRFGWGGEQVDSYLGDYPQFVPGALGSGQQESPGWMLLSSGKTAAASSSLADHSPDLGFDENARTWWSAASGGVGEWLSVDLGVIARVAALQINFAEQGTQALGRTEDNYHQYIVESSIDGVHWTTRLDESSTTRDTPHRYVQLDTARNARFVRITNVHAAGGGYFAIRDLRIFGWSPVAAPAAVVDLSAKRSADEARATITWRRTARATAYIVRFGTAGDKLYASHRVGDIAGVTLDGLNPAAPYWFVVDAIGEGGIARGRTPVVARPDT